MTINEDSINHDEPNMYVVEEGDIMLEGKTVAEARDILHEGIFHGSNQTEAELGLEALDTIAGYIDSVLEVPTYSDDLRVVTYPEGLEDALIKLWAQEGGSDEEEARFYAMMYAMGTPDYLIFEVHGQTYTLLEGPDA